MAFVIVRGDARHLPLADGSVHCCVTSPPYWGLRDYGVQGQLGLEPTPEEYVANMVQVFREIWRVLRPDGTVWLNLGDSYATGAGRVGGCPGGGAQGERWKGYRGDHAASPKHSPHAVGPLTQPNRMPIAGLKPKDLVGIPWRVAFALQADGWWLRSDIVWAKPNPMPESVTDRPTKAHEYLFLLAKSARYYYDHEAIKEKPESGPSDIRKMVERLPRIGGKHKELDDPLSKASALTNIGRKRSVGDPSGRNRRSVWTVATEPYSGAHFATFPRRLVEPCVLAGTSGRGCCPRCGAPWERVAKRTGGKSIAGPKTQAKRDQGLATAFSGYDDGSTAPTITTLYWRPICGCYAEALRDYCTQEGLQAEDVNGLAMERFLADRLPPVPCTVLDPFGGAGTTALVADRLGRVGVAVDLSDRYCRMARRRCYQDAPLLAYAGGMMR